LGSLATATLTASLVELSEELELLESLESSELELIESSTSVGEGCFA